MKISDIKVGQLFSAHFPRHKDLEFRKRKFGFRVIKIEERWEKDGRAVTVENVKDPGEIHRYAFPMDAKFPGVAYGEVPYNWVLIEDVH